MSHTPISPLPLDPWVDNGTEFDPVWLGSENKNHSDFIVMSDPTPSPTSGEVATTVTKKNRFALVLDAKEDHGNWSSRLAFFLATMGAAIGFGNVWRFPSLMFAFGGGAFLIPYLMALFLLGIPLAILEIGFGQYFQTGDIGVFGSFHPRLRGVG
jgi:Sodium:neurotransmitter symporter family